MADPKHPTLCGKSQLRTLFHYYIHSHNSHTSTYLQFSHADTAHVNQVNKSTGVTTAASFGVSTMSDEDVIVISDSESETETVCDEIQNYYFLWADDDGDLVDASMDIRYDLEWASGGWLDYTWNEELMELFGEFEDGNWVGEIDVLEGPDNVIENIIPRGDTSSPPSLKQLTHTALLSVVDTYVFNMHEECRSES